MFCQLSVEVQQDQEIRMRVALGVYIIADEDSVEIPHCRISARILHEDITLTLTSWTIVGTWRLCEDSALEIWRLVDMDNRTQ